MLGDTLDDGGELQVLAAIVAEEVIEVEGIVGIEVVDHCHGIPFDVVLLEQFDASLHLEKGGAMVGGAPILIVKLLGSIDRDAHEPLVVVEEAAPLVGEKRAIGLDAVADDAATTIISLQLEDSLIEGEGTHQRLASVPCEEHFGLCLCLDILANELLEELVAHDMTGLVGIEMTLLEVVAVTATQIAMRTCGFRHDV